MGAYFLAKHNGGNGVLLGGVPGVLPGRVVVLGGGTSGVNAARMATGLGADVTILEVDLERMRFLDITMHSAHTLYSSEAHLTELMPTVDLLIGAVLVPGSESAQADHARNAARDAARQRGRGHRDRPGRLRGNFAPDHAPRSGLCRGRRHPLLRREHAGGLCAHRDPGANEHYLSLCRAPGGSRVEGSLRTPAGAARRHQYAWTAGSPIAPWPKPTGWNSSRLSSADEAAHLLPKPGCFSRSRANLRKIKSTGPKTSLAPNQ